MRKIPTLYKRDPDDMRRVLREFTPGCEWVANGEGRPTRKYDGTCVMFDGENWWARREVKPGKEPPPGWVQVDHDEVTGKRVGWEPAEQSAFAKWLDDALSQGMTGYLSVPQSTDMPPPPGTYELIGPKINGNPEGLQDGRHVLVMHGYEAAVDRAWLPRRLDFDSLRAWMMATEWEGIVWHHPDGRMAKLKRRDFPPTDRADTRSSTDVSGRSGA